MRNSSFVNDHIRNIHQFYPFQRLAMVSDHMPSKGISFHGHRCSHPLPFKVIAQNSLLLQFLPLLRGVALWCPSVDSRNLLLKRSIHQPMSGEHILILEMGRNDNCHKSLSAATCIIAPQKSALTYIQYLYIA